VVATQNPVEHNGTYPLPEAQLDRFCMKISLGYPEHEHEVRLLLDQEHVHPLADVVAVMDTEALVELQEAVKSIEVESSVLEYIVRLVASTRKDTRLRLGASPRGALDLRRCAQAAAFLAGRTAVRPEDVQKLAVSVLAHRLLVEVKARHSGLTSVTVIEDAVKAEPVPA
jgi:MoxR-like ATPase